MKGEMLSQIKSPKFKEAFKRLLTNKVFMYNFGSSLFYVFAFMGFGTFMPKYMEYTFRMKASTTAGMYRCHHPNLENHGSILFVGCSKLR